MKKQNSSKYLPATHGSIVIVVIILAVLFSTLLFIYFSIPLVSSNLIKPLGKIVENAAKGEYENAEILISLATLLFSFVLGAFINNWYTGRIQYAGKRYDIKSGIIKDINRYALALTSNDMTQTNRKQLLTELRVYQNLTVIYFKSEVTSCLKDYISDPSNENYYELMLSLKTSQ